MLRGRDGLLRGTEQAGVRGTGEQPGLHERMREGEVAGVTQRVGSVAGVGKQNTDGARGASPGGPGAAGAGERTAVS